MGDIVDIVDSNVELMEGKNLRSKMASMEHALESEGNSSNKTEGKL